VVKILSISDGLLTLLKTCRQSVYNSGNPKRLFIVDLIFIVLNIISILFFISPI